MGSGYTTWPLNIAAPSSDTTAALEIGSQRLVMAAGNVANRSMMLRARTSAMPMATRTDARPTLNAMIMAMPNICRWSDTATISTPSASGQGMRPPEAPNATNRRMPTASLTAC